VPRLEVLPPARLGESAALLLEEHRSGPSPATLETLGLTRREAAVLAHVARGETNAEIALALSISPRTAQKHVEHINAKLGVGTRTAAAAVAWRAG
jgi:DNA-binding CsgD family transcriptional regulator